MSESLSKGHKEGQKNGFHIIMANIIVEYTTRRDFSHHLEIHGKENALLLDNGTNIIIFSNK